MEKFIFLLRGWKLDAAAAAAELNLHQQLPVSESITSDTPAELTNIVYSAAAVKLDLAVWHDRPKNPSLRLTIFGLDLRVHTPASTRLERLRIGVCSDENAWLEERH